MMALVTTAVGATIYVLGIVLFGAIYLASPHAVPVFHETQWYAALAFGFLYIALLIRPLYVTFPALPYEHIALESRRALGISAFFFALLHAYFGFFGFVGGFQGLRYWSDYFAGSLLCGLLALCLLAVAATTSIPYVLRRMGRYGNSLHRCIYVAGILILAHSVTVTIHLLRLRDILVVIYPFLLLLLGLEMLRLDRYATGRYRRLPKRVVTVIGFPLASILLFWSLFLLDHHAH
jgi:DMSO/TMAO reductase YedYZ heme-binding membrane subunit